MEGHIVEVKFNTESDFYNWCRYVGGYDWVYVDMGNCREFKTNDGKRFAIAHYTGVGYRVFTTRVNIGTGIEVP